MNGLDFGKFGITYEALKSIRNVLAFDLGHGESTVSFIKVDENGEIEQLNLTTNSDKKIVTGLFKMNKESKQWRLERLGGIAGMMNEIHIEFKALPTTLNAGVQEDGLENSEGKRYTKKELLQTFIVEVLSNVKKYIGEDIVPSPETTLLFVGYPSSGIWKDQDVEYAKIISEVSPYPVVVMPESRAALFKMLLGKKMNGLQSLEKGIIVFDFGSSTADWTYLYRDMKKGKVDSDEDSEMLGGSMIEECMRKKGLEHFLEEQRKKRLEKIRNYEMLLRSVSRDGIDGEEEIHRKAVEMYEKTDAQNEKTDEIKKWYEEDAQKYRLELRSHKEQYFDADTKEYRKKYVTDLDDFEFEINSDFMENPVDGVIFRKYRMGTKSGIKWNSWYGECEELFQSVKRRLEGCPYEMIILTGGASKMGFLQKLAKEVFAGKKILADQIPSTCVSRGMAYAAQMDIRAQIALPDVMERIIKRIKQSTNLQNYTDKADNVMKGMDQQLYEQVIWKGLQKWQDGMGNSTTNEAIKICQDELKNSQEGRGYQEIIGKGIREVIIEFVADKKEEIIKCINETFEDIYKQTIPKEYRIQIDNSQIEELAGKVVGYRFGQQFDDIIVAALSYSGGGILDRMFGTRDVFYTKEERTKKIQRIKEMNREQSIVQYCKGYLKALLTLLIENNMSKCLEGPVRTMLNDMAAYFA